MISFSKKESKLGPYLVAGMIGVVLAAIFLFISRTTFNVVRSVVFFIADHWVISLFLVIGFFVAKRFFRRRRYIQPVQIVDPNQA